MKERPVTTAIAAKALGMSSDNLRRLKAVGDLQPGKHYIIVSGSGSGRERCSWYVEAIQETLAAPPALRAQPQKA
jgi:hypothetical protein